MNKKILIIGIVLLASVGVLISVIAKNKDDSKDTKPTDTQTNISSDNTNDILQDETEEEPKVVPTNINPLTGIGDMSEKGMGSRPVAVMINNVDDALPQYGISAADLIFEIPVEGNLTRLMALYADYTKVPYICSVRSCREYFPAFSEGFDAFYVCWGSADGAEEYMESLGTTVFNGYHITAGLFGRDADRKNNGYAMEHTSYFDGRNLPNVLENNDYRITIEEDKTGNFFKFHDYFEQVKPSETLCNNVLIEFGFATAKFDYNEKTNSYYKEINGKKHLDGITGEQLSFTNVFVLETSITMHPDGEHKIVKWNVDKAVGYYISNGTIKQIYWSKHSESDKLVFYDENGEELVLNRGKTYIAVTNKGKASFH